MWNMRVLFDENTVSHTFIIIQIQKFFYLRNKHYTVNVDPEPDYQGLNPDYTFD